MGMTLKCDMSGVRRMVLSVGSDVDAAVRPSAQAGAEVLYRAVKRNVAAIGKVTGNLDSSIYQAFSLDNSGPGRATYHISWNARKAPHGHLLEYGHVQRFAVYMGKDGKWYTDKSRPIPPRQVAARPFIRPAIASFNEAAAAAETELLHRIGAV